MAKTDSFIQLLEQIEGLEFEDLTLDRGDFLIREGEVEKRLYHIISGAVHAFYVSEHEEHTIRFGYEGSMMNSISSFLNQTGSELYFQAIRKTKVRVYTRSSFYKTKETNPLLQQLYISALENLAHQQMEREIDLLTASPIERLKRVQKRSPRLFQEIPAKYIASYLRMTPETLSRIQNS
jgi:CRP-like cAMP-binding protein